MQSLWELTEHKADRAPTDALTPNSHYDSIVVGAGLTGLTTALLLARAGQRVAVIEARSIGAVTTGKSTAKLSLLHGGALGDIRAHTSSEVLRAYVEGNREGQQWLIRYLDEHGIDVERRDAYSYAVNDAGVDELKREYDACVDAGLAAEFVHSTEMPFGVGAAIRLEHQAQFNPMQVLRQLSADVRGRGAIIAEGSRVRGVTPGDPCTVNLDEYAVTADRVVLATGIPILDRGLSFAKLKPLRSYITAFRLPDGHKIPQGMYLSLDTPTRSTRTATVNGETLLLVGGSGHVVGREHSAQAHIDELVSWTTEHFTGADPLYFWSAQDYQSIDRLPFVGQLPRSEGKVYLATGFNKWGMTNAVASALSLSSEILGGHMEWAETLHNRGTSTQDIGQAILTNVEVAKHLATGWSEAELTPLPDTVPAMGEGVVGREDGRPVAVSHTASGVCALSAICTHLGGIVSWNDAEQSWDCPLHGSRFGADGTLLEGPAVDNLTPLTP